jgi:hypothetical protein
MTLFEIFATSAFVVGMRITVIRWRRFEAESLNTHPNPNKENQTS